jgi:hypothetical protein
MKKILFSITACFLMYTASAQTEDSAVKKNLAKINVTSLFLKTFSFQYERAISKKTALALGIRTMPKSGLPLKSQFISLIDDPETKKQVDNFQTGNFAITPEIRFYLGKKAAFSGFYFAPFVRFTTFTADLPYDFTVNGVKETIPLSGNLKTVTPGFLLGAQWKLGKVLSLDWWILGPQYGSSNGKIEGKKTLSTQEQQSLRSDLQDFEIPFATTTTTVDANGAKVEFKGPWAGLRAGLSLGVRF